MTRPRVKCGTYSGYNTHHHNKTPVCDPCRDAARAYRKARYTARLVDPAPVIAHIDNLIANGSTLRGIAAAAGLNFRTVQEVRERTGIWPETAAALLSVKVGWIDKGPAVGTARRIDALRRMGWPIAELAERLGVSQQQVHKLTRQARVTKRTADRIAMLYDELCMTPGPSGIVRARSTTAGRVPPLAWDDDDLDDPAAWANETDGTDVIDPVVVERLCADPNAWRNGLTATTAEKWAAAERLGASSWKALGVNGKTGRRAAA